MLGAPSEPPDIPFRLVGPGRESGTRAMLIELTVAPIAGRRTQVADLRADYTAQQSDHLILAETLREPTSLGFVGFAVVVPWGAQVKRIAIDAGQGCIRADEERAVAGEYPLRARCMRM